MTPLATLRSPNGGALGSIRSLMGLAVLVWISGCSDPPPAPAPFDPLTLVDPSETNPPWSLWADVREVVGAPAFDAATGDWLPAMAAEALAAAGPPDREERLYDGLWRLELEREALLAELEAAGTPRVFPLADNHPPRHWRVLLEHWYGSGDDRPRFVRYTEAFMDAWGTEPAAKLPDPRLLQRFLSAHPMYPEFRSRWWSSSWGTGGSSGSVTVDIPFALTAQQPEGFGHHEVRAVLWLLEQGAPPEDFDLRAFEARTRARLAELERGTVPTVTVDSARLELERARRLVEHYLE